MTRLSIDITPEQHQRLKAVAALHGKSIKDYVLEQALPSIPDLDALSDAVVKGDRAVVGVIQSYREDDDPFAGISGGESDFDPTDGVTD